MIDLQLEQGSDEWKAARINYLVASEAPVIMGESPHMKRDELLKLKATGNEKDINEWVEKFVFKKGHETEALARPIAEKRLGKDLYPVTGALDVGLPKFLLASYDGLTMLEDNSWEHKQFNKDLHELVKNNGELEGKHFWQLEHQMLVAETESCVFACSDGTEERYAEMVYHSRPERREQLILGWKLFLEDLDKYEYVPEAVTLEGEQIKDLPALNIQISGEVKSSNLALYQDTALTFIKNIKTDLSTDQDFADAEVAVKFCSKAEKELEVVKCQTLGQAVSIDEIVKTIDVLKEKMRSKRLTLEKLVRTKKEDIRAEIVTKAKQQWLEYLGDVNASLKRVSLPSIIVDIAEAIKGKRTIDTLRSAANDAVAKAKIEAGQYQNLILANLESLSDIAGDYEFLFSDLQQLCIKDNEAFEAICKQIVSDHKAAEEKRIQEEAQRLADKIEADRIAEEERKRIAEENRVKAEQEAAEKQKRDEVNRIALECAQQSSVVRRTPIEPALAQAEEFEAPELKVPAPIVGSPDASRSIAGLSPKPKQPTEDEIIGVIASHYNVDERTAVKWLNAMFTATPQSKAG